MHYWLVETTADLTSETAAWIPPGKVVPAGAQYAHVLIAEDYVFNEVCQGKSPLYTSDFEDRTGFSELQPDDWDWLEWGCSVVIDMPLLRDYATAVFASTDAFLASLTDTDLPRVHDFSVTGMGVRPLSARIVTTAINGAAHCGEIAAIKGLQSLKGYPF